MFLKPGFCVPCLLHPTTRLWPEPITTDRHLTSSVFRIHRDIILLATLGFPNGLVPERFPTEMLETLILRQEAEMDHSVARRPV
jgi:hypothetical protein